MIKIYLKFVMGFKDIVYNYIPFVKDKDNINLNLLIREKKPEVLGVPLKESSGVKFPPSLTGNIIKECEK